MAWEGTGNVQPAIDRAEHSAPAVAKRVLPVGLSDAGSDYLSPTIRDFAQVNGRSALEVILVDVNGDLYTAGAVSGTVTVGGGSIEVTSLPDIAGTVTVGGGSIEVSNVLSVLGTVTVGGGSIEVSNVLSVLGTVTVGGGSIGVSSLPAIEGTVTVGGGSIVVTSLPSIEGTVTVGGGSIGVSSLPAIEGTVTVGGGSIDLAMTTTPRMLSMYVGGVATQFTDLGVTTKHGVGIRLSPSATNNVWVGYSSAVTSGIAQATTGFILEPGDFVSVEVSSSTLLWGVTGGAFTEEVFLVGA